MKIGLKKIRFNWIKVNLGLKSIGAIALFYISIFFAYYLALAPMFSYSFTEYNPNYKKLAISLLLVITTYVFFPKNLNKASTFLFYIFYLITYIPTVAFFWMNNKPTKYIIMETICFLVVSVMLRIASKPVCFIIENSNVLIKFTYFVFLILGLYLVMNNGGIHFHKLLDSIYLVRSENNLNGIIGYMLNWCAKSMMPFLLAVFLFKKDYIRAMIVSIFQVMFFLSYGFKAFLMAIFMIFIMYFVMKWSDKFMFILALLFSIINFAALVLYFVGNDTLLKLFPYRTLILPSQGQFEYYDFFTTHDYLYFSEGTIGRLIGIRYPYSQSIGHIVNIFIYGPSKISNGNTGVFSYGFADLGFVGMVLTALLIGLLFLTVDSLGSKLPIVVPVCAMAYQMFILNDNSIFIALNTGGIVFTVLFISILNASYNKNMEPKKNHFKITCSNGRKKVFIDSKKIGNG